MGTRGAPSVAPALGRCPSAPFSQSEAQLGVVWAGEGPVVALVTQRLRPRASGELNLKHHPKRLSRKRLIFAIPPSTQSRQKRGKETHSAASHPGAEGERGPWPPKPCVQ